MRPTVTIRRQADNLACATRWQPIPSPDFFLAISPARCVVSISLGKRFVQAGHGQPERRLVLLANCGTLSRISHDTDDSDTTGAGSDGYERSPGLESAGGGRVPCIEPLLTPQGLYRRHCVLARGRATLDLRASAVLPDESKARPWPGPMRHPPNTSTAALTTE